MPYVFGKPLNGEAIGLKIGDPVPAMIVDQHILAFLLIYTPRQRSNRLRLFLIFLSGLLLGGWRCEPWSGLRRYQESCQCHLDNASHLRELQMQV
jgi:hypothetical protein